MEDHVEDYGRIDGACAQLPLDAARGGLSDPPETPGWRAVACPGGPWVSAAQGTVERLRRRRTSKRQQAVLQKMSHQIIERIWREGGEMRLMSSRQTSGITAVALSSATGRHAGSIRTWLTTGPVGAGSATSTEFRLSRYLSPSMDRRTAAQ